MQRQQRDDKRVQISFQKLIVPSQQRFLQFQPVTEYCAILVDAQQMIPNFPICIEIFTRTFSKCCYFFNVPPHIYDPAYVNPCRRPNQGHLFPFLDRSDKKEQIYLQGPSSGPEFCVVWLRKRPASG